MEIGGGSRGDVKLEQHNLRDLLRMKEDDHRNNMNHSHSSHGGGSGSSGLTLLALFNEKYEPLPPVDEPLRGSNSSRTLYDIIREDRMSGYGSGRSDGGRSWRQLRDKIRRRQGGRISSWSSSVHTQDSDSPFNNHQHSNRTAVARRLSDRLDSIANSAESTQPVPHTAPDASSSISYLTPNRETETASGRINQRTSPPVNTSALQDHPRQEESTERRGGADAVETAETSANQSRAAEQQPARMSLMALLTENDRQMGLKRSAYVMYEDSKDARAGAAEEEEGGGGGDANNCCVCMVRHKGAAFIPCGHTFCRQCSRELWVQRGNCPICNNCILEILDIF